MPDITYYIGQNKYLIDDIIKGMDVDILQAVDMIYYNRVTREQATQVREILGLEEPIEELFIGLGGPMGPEGLSKAMREGK